MLRPHPKQQQNQETMQTENPYSSWWKNLAGTHKVDLVVLVEDNARNDFVSFNNVTSASTSCNNVGDPSGSGSLNSQVSRSSMNLPAKQTWNPTKDSVVGFGKTNKNRWGGSPEGEKEWFRLQQKHQKRQQHQQYLQQT